MSREDRMSRLEATRRCAEYTESDAWNSVEFYKHRSYDDYWRNDREEWSREWE